MGVSGRVGPMASSVGLQIIVGWASPTQPITRTVTYPSHVACIRAILEIEAQQPWDMEKQRYRGKQLNWSVEHERLDTD